MILNSQSKRKLFSVKLKLKIMAVHNLNTTLLKAWKWEFISVKMNVSFRIGTNKISQWIFYDTHTLISLTDGTCVLVVLFLKVHGVFWYGKMMIK